MKHIKVCGMLLAVIFLLTGCVQDTAVGKADNFIAVDSGVYNNDEKTNAEETMIKLPNIFSENNNKEFLLTENMLANSAQAVYPYLSANNLINAEKAEAINALILNEAANKTEAFEENDEVNLQYEIATFNDNYLSIVFYLDAFNDTMPHPARKMFTVNIDLAGEQLFCLKDAVDITQEFAKKVFDAENIVSPAENTITQDTLFILIPYTQDLYAGITALTACDTAQQTDNALYSYYKDGKIYVAAEILYAAGSNIIFECK